MWWVAVSVFNVHMYKIPGNKAITPHQKSFFLQQLDSIRKGHTIGQNSEFNGMQGSWTQLIYL